MRPVVLALSAVLALAACGDPLRGVERVSDGAVDLPEGNLSGNALAEEAPAPRSGFLGLFRSGAAEEAPEEADVSVATRNDPEAAASPEQEVRPERRGLFGGLFSARAEAPANDVETASLSPIPSGGGLFAPRSVPAPRNAPDAEVVALGTVLPFGAVARVCDAAPRDFGKRVEQAGQGASRFALYDSAPDSTAPRSFYVTGFSDGCARKFTAALALFGDPAMHEQLRYGRPSEQYPYSTTDTAYETVKSVVCGVPRRKPCGARIDSLSRNTVFISVYERFTDNGRWADILLHDGMVLAAAVKDL